jgi:hypothetical protein
MTSVFALCEKASNFPKFAPALSFGQSHPCQPCNKHVTWSSHQLKRGPSPIQAFCMSCYRASRTSVHHNRYCLPFWLSLPSTSKLLLDPCTPSSSWFARSRPSIKARIDHQMAGCREARVTCSLTRGIQKSAPVVEHNFFFLRPKVG